MKRSDNEAVSCKSQKEMFCGSGLGLEGFEGCCEWGGDRRAAGCVAATGIIGVSVASSKPVHLV